MNVISVCDLYEGVHELFVPTVGVGMHNSRWRSSAWFILLSTWAEILHHSSSPLSYSPSHGPAGFCRRRLLLRLAEMLNVSDAEELNSGRQRGWNTAGGTERMVAPTGRGSALQQRSQLQGRDTHSVHIQDSVLDTFRHLSLPSATSLLKIYSDFVSSELSNKRQKNRRIDGDRQRLCVLSLCSGPSVYH